MAHRIQLVVVEPANKAQTFSVSLAGEGDECVIGRAQQCGVTIDDDMTADRHCRVYVEGGAVRVENLDLEIGTCLDDDFLAEPCALPASCRLLVGATLLEVAVEAAEGEPAPAKPAPASPKRIEPASRADDSATRDESVWPKKPTVPVSDPSQADTASEALFEEPRRTPTPPSAPPVEPEREPEPVRVEQAKEREVQPPADKPAASPAPTTDAGGGDANTSRSWARAMTYSADASLFERIERDLREEFGSRASVRDAVALRSLIARGAERAKGYGLTEDEHVFQFIRCMVLLDDEIDGRNPDTEDVWLTLNHAKRPAAQRIERAIKIASRLSAERSGSRSKSSGAVAARPMPAAPVAAAAPPVAPAPEAPSHGFSRAGRTSGLTDADVTADPEHSSATHATRGTPPPPPDAGAEESLPEIPGFTIKEEVGAGGMGRVFLAHDQQLDKDVAIKVLRSVDPESQEQLQHEARAAAKLEHPNIVQVMRFEKLGRGGFYVMSFVRGLDGSKLVKRFEQKGAHQLGGEAVLGVAGVDPKRSPAELRELLQPDKNAYYRIVANWIAGVADGLERANSEGVLHRDIKPSNLLISADGRMMVTDFGLAARPSDRQGVGRARVGTPRYLSPERVADWASFSDDVQPNDARADIWSLGCVLYEFLTYRPAFRGTVAEVLREIVTQSPEKPSSLVWSVPEPLERICLMAMARRPDDRFMKAGDMAEALRGWLRVDTGVEKRGRIPFLT